MSLKREDNKLISGSKKIGWSIISWLNKETIADPVIKGQPQFPSLY